jgi:DNA-binding NtrC family response regulator
VSYIKVLVPSSLDRVEINLIRATLKHFDGDKMKAAKSLGITCRTLYYRLASYKLKGETI